MPASDLRLETLLERFDLRLEAVQSHPQLLHFCPWGVLSLSAHQLVKALLDPAEPFIEPMNRGDEIAVLCLQHV
jgi:hypothetical protein